jgi:putative transposase
MSYCQVYLHYVWTTRLRNPFLNSKEVRQKVWSHITLNGKKKKINVIITSGHNDHCHCLVMMPKDKTLSQIAQLLKGECSRWINENDIIPTLEPKGGFAWQHRYFVKSICPEHVQGVISYLQNQESHHLDKGLEDEFDEFLKE